MEFHYEYAGKSYPVRIKKDGDSFRTIIGDKEFVVKSKEVKPGFFVLSIDGRPVKVCMSNEGSQRHIFLNGAIYRFTKAEGKRKKGEGFDTLSPNINSPISGKVVKVDVSNGITVVGGQTLLTIEAMKMEYQIKAPYAGIVEKVNFKQGDPVDIGVILVQMKKIEGEKNGVH
jgi:3-methylcrotonyl-CoA carboxylase alpha subunit